MNEKEKLNVAIELIENELEVCEQSDDELANALKIVKRYFEDLRSDFE